MDIYKSFATNQEAEQSGIWEDNDDASFLIARAHNKRFDRLITSLVQKNRKLLDAKGDAGEAKSEEIMVETMAKTILLGWKGNVTFNGDVLEYSVDNAKKLLAVKDFREWVASVSNDFDRYKAVKEEDEAKN